MSADAIIAINRHDPAVAPATGPERPVLYFDFADPEGYLALERCTEALGQVPVLEPALIGPPAFRCAEEQQIHQQEIERRAAARDLQPLRWPEQWPDGDPTPVLLAATYAKRIGKVAAFSLAAFRQAFAGGGDLADTDTVLIAGAACEIHPRALLKALETESIRQELHRATLTARVAGVRTSPSLVVGHEVFPGDAGLDAARVAMAS